jgi:hypothetical protein
MPEVEAFLTRDGILLMIQHAIETYDVKVSAPRHAENQVEMHRTTEKISELCTVLHKIEGAVTAFKWIGGIVAFAWTLTQIAHTALTMVQALHK